MIIKLLFMLTLLIGSPVNALTVNLVAAIDEGQVVPPSLSLAFGTGVFQYDTVLNILSNTIVFTDVLLSSPEISATLNGPAPVGVNGPPITNLGLGSLKLGPVDFSLVASCSADPEICEADLLAGQWYVLVSSEDFPDGEIRGQIVPVTPVAEAGTFVMLTLGLIGLLFASQKQLLS